MKKLKYRLSSAADVEHIKVLLKEEGLPVDDINEHLDSTIVAEEEGVNLVGLGAIEMYGKVGLLRSLVVKKNKRNQNYGAAIMNYIEHYATNNGIKELYLLTEHASNYFKRQNFEEISRDLAPVEIKKTKQFSSLCPTSAVVMRKYL